MNFLKIIIAHLPIYLKSKMTILMLILELVSSSTISSLYSLDLREKNTSKYKEKNIKTYFLLGRMRENNLKKEFNENTLKQIKGKIKE